MINISFDSQMLSALMRCARLCKYQFIDDLELPGGKSNSLETGSLAHCVYEFFNKGLASGKSRADSIEQGFKAGKEYILPYSDYNKFVLDKDHKGLINTPKEGEGKKSDEYGVHNYVIGWEYVFKTMEEYFDHYRNDTYTVIAAEEVRGRLVYEDEFIRVLYKAKFDSIIDTNVGIMSNDLKTMKQRKDSLSTNVQFTGQCAILNARYVRVDKLGWQTSLKPHEKFTRQIISYSVDALHEFCNDIVPHYARMLIAYSEAENFPPNYTACKTEYGKCDFYESVCTADRNLRDDILRTMFVKKKHWDISND